MLNISLFFNLIVFLSCIMTSYSVKSVQPICLNSCDFLFACVAVDALYNYASFDLSGKCRWSMQVVVLSVQVCL